MVDVDQSSPGTDVGWVRTWSAPCIDLHDEFVSLEVPRGTTDRVQVADVDPAKSGSAMRVTVRDGDWAWNPYANGGAGAIIPGGWRAEAVGPFEEQSERPVQYRW